METVAQITYRDVDRVILITAVNPIAPKRFYLSELAQVDQDKFDALKTFCLTKVDSLEYVVYFENGYSLNIQGIKDDEKVNLVELTNEMTGTDKTMIDEVGVLCTTLLNS